MISTRQFRKKIKSAKNIAKVTRAMEMIAASKMKKAQDQAKLNRPYSEGIEELSSVLINQTDPSIHPLLNKTTESMNELVLLVTPDKGLCGALLTNLTKFLFNSFPSLDSVEFITVGKKAKTIVLNLGGVSIAEFNLGLSSPKYEIVPSIALAITDKYLKEDVKVSVVYTSFINTMSQKPNQKVLLPLNLTENALTQPQEANKSFYLFEPSAEEITKSLLGMYLEKEIYQYLLEAYASEQSARMVAMKNATDNAQDLIGALTLEYNQARQAGITMEIINIDTAVANLN